MIALDTNVIVRFLVKDDLKEARRASKIFRGLSDSNKGFVSREALLELVWVLEGAYKYSSAEITKAVYELLYSAEMVIEAADDVGPALERYRNEDFGFADLMIAAAARRSNSSELVTFGQNVESLEGVRRA